ncbi:MAG: hypothetical protein WKF75_12985 [Singulisphaera sp.]
MSRPLPVPLRLGPGGFRRLIAPSRAAADVPSPAGAACRRDRADVPRLADVPWGGWRSRVARPRGTLLARLALSLVPGLHLVARSSPMTGARSPPRPTRPGEGSA